VSTTPSAGEFEVNAQQRALRKVESQRGFSAESSSKGQLTLRLLHDSVYDDDRCRHLLHVLGLVRRESVSTSVLLQARGQLCSRSSAPKRKTLRKW
jgi:hypothetical protein